MALERSRKQIEPELTLEGVAKYCTAHGYSLRDAKYRPSYWLNSVTGHKPSTATVFMCTCGWASERHGCPQHG